MPRPPGAGLARFSGALARPHSGTMAGAVGLLAGAVGIVARNASFRSVWLRNSVRGAVGLAAAVAVADLTGVQHGFWVVLGTLSVLRTNASSTGATAMRALAGTALGFAVGAAVLLGIGTGPTALWIALPIAVLIASYAPGTAPFAVGQAAFTVTVLVLFNLLAPAGWRVGLLRVEDVAIGAAVSLVVGALFWPRGAAAAVGDDLADADRAGGEYLTQAVDWALGLRGRAPDTAVAAATAGGRLDDALRGYLAEQGTKRVPKEELWRLVMASVRLRLTANSLAGIRGRGAPEIPTRPSTLTRTGQAAGPRGRPERFLRAHRRPGRAARPRRACAHRGRAARRPRRRGHVQRRGHAAPPPPAHPLGPRAPAPPRRARWRRTAPALHVAQLRRTPWWH